MLLTPNGIPRLVVMNVRSYQEQQETLALQQLLAMGHQEIEQGKFSSAEALFAEMETVQVAEI